MGGTTKWYSTFGAPRPDKSRTLRVTVTLVASPALWFIVLKIHLQPFLSIATVDATHSWSFLTPLHMSVIYSRNFDDVPFWKDVIRSIRSLTSRCYTSTILIFPPWCPRNSMNTLVWQKQQHFSMFLATNPEMRWLYFKIYFIGQTSYRIF